MTRRSARQADTDDLAFPIRVKLRVPTTGLGNVLTDLLMWLSAEVGPGNFAQHPGPTLGGEAVAIHFRRISDAARFLDAKVVLLTQDVGKGPVAQAVDVAELAFAVEDFLRPFAADAQRFGESAQQLDDLCYVIVVFAVLCARLRVEEVVACDKFEGLEDVVSMLSCRLSLTMMESSQS